VPYNSTQHNANHTEKDHLQQAERCERFSKFVLRHDRQKEFGDWYASAAFYSALNYIDALFHVMEPSLTVNITKDVENTIVVKHCDLLDGILGNVASKFYRETAHNIRLKTLKQNPAFDILYEKYSSLYSAVQSGRFNFMNPNQYDPVAIGECLNELIDECKRLTNLKRAGKIF
jgi:hypothetical protein